MKPDEKYMPSSYRKSDDDLTFVPFTAPSPLIGWTPQNLFDGSSVNNIPNSMIMTPQMNSQLNLPNLGVNPNMNMQPQQPNLYPNQNYMGYNKPINTWQLPSQSIDTNPSSMSYGEQLSAYYNPQNNTPTNQGIDTNPSSMGYGEQLSANYNNNYSNQSNNNTNTNSYAGGLPSSKYNANNMNTMNSQSQGTGTNPSYANNSGYTPNLINNPNSPQNKDLSIQYPDDTSSDILYSYNNANVNTTDTSNNTPNTSTNNMNNNITNNTNVKNPAELLRSLNLDVDEDIDLIRCCKDDDINKLYKEIENDCPGILSLLEAYNIPSPIAKLIIRRIIKITMRYCKK
ncbi:hypothetical protein [Clostridium paraputrificum]|uniref:Uncharacterized protein n=1 Tax=Clostridium paraputrificum TaxID=29363 RepID=A0A6N3FWV5_9CLOT